MTTPEPYSYPVDDPHYAQDVTMPHFQPDLFADSDLYVNMDAVRGREFLDKLLFRFGISGDQMVEQRTYKKIIFSGHRGCGKTAELRRIEKQAIPPGTYLPVFIALEEEVDLSRFRAEDFYILLVVHLIDLIRTHQLQVKTKPLRQLSEAILQRKEVVEELRTTLKNELTAEASAGVNFFEIIKSKLGFKAIFSGESKTSQFIRREVKENLLRIIQEFNVYLQEVRRALRQENQAQDLLFVVDGSEKVPFTLYQELFVQGANMIREIAANMIIAVPINAFYTIQDEPQASYDDAFVVPMVPLNKPEAEVAFRTLLAKRIRLEQFIEEEALHYLIQKSGGCTRQLLSLVSQGIGIGLGAPITLDTAKKAALRLQEDMRNLLSAEHIQLLKKGNFYTGDAAVKELLYSLVLLRYNGPDSIRINPLLEGLFETDGADV
ncbi:MAG TPA: hypothetical protein DCP28_26165 [Cytophagales bacterium]|nr:hypothetical protein [Cytophagales bacterium]